MSGGLQVVLQSTVGLDIIMMDNYALCRFMSR